MKELNFKHKPSLRRTYSILGALVVILFVYGCDTFKDDDLNLENSAEIGSNKVYLYPNTSSVIDFNKVVNAREKVTISITEQPEKGDFKNVKDNFFKYEPNKNFLTGKDKVGFSVVNTSNDQVLSGVIEITVISDTTQFPCGIFAIPDVAMTDVNTPVLINVLSNDVSCDSLQPEEFQLSIVQGPANGEASVRGFEINYVPNAQFKGVDNILYKINSSVEPDSGSVALVTIFVGDTSTCLLTANDDFRDFHSANEGFIDINVLENDIICGMDVVLPGSLTLSTQPKHSDAAFVANNMLRVWVNPNKSDYSDSLIYNLCAGQLCDQAMVKVSFITQDSCFQEAIDDFYNISDSTQTTSFFFDVLVNDNYCNLSNVELEIVNLPKNGQAISIDKQIQYEITNNQATGDSLTYRICEDIIGGFPCSSATVRVEF